MFVQQTQYLILSPYRGIEAPREWGMWRECRPLPSGGEVWGGAVPQNGGAGPSPLRIEACLTPKTKCYGGKYGLTRSNGWYTEIFRKKFDFSRLAFQIRTDTDRSATQDFLY